MKKLLGAIALILIAQAGWSQCKEFKWPADRAKAEEQLAIYGDAIKQQNYRAAVPGIRWFLQNAPDFNTKIYIEGADVYQKLASAEKDAAKKAVLVDSLMWFYDERIRRCGDEINVLNRKATYAAVFNGQSKEKTADVLKLFDRLFEIGGNNISDGNLDTYFKIVYANFALLKNVPEDDVLKRYDKLIGVIDGKITVAQQANKTADVEKLKQIKSGVDNLLIQMVKVDCEFVKKNLEPKFRQNPNDLAMAKRIFGFMLQGKCTDDPLWVEAGEVVHKLNPEKDFGLAINLGKKYMSADNNAKAVEYAKEAQAIAKTPADKAESFILIGATQAKSGNKSAARESYRAAVAADPSSKEALEKIGDLYASSMDDCKKLESQAQDRLIFIAAYEMYTKAGANEKMAQVKGQFPSKEDIFVLSWKTGDQKSTGCWVGETVTVRTRD